MIIISNKFQFKFINPHSVSILPLALIIKFFKKKIKLIYDTHELETEISGMSFVRKFITKIVERLCIHFCDKIVVVSPSIKEWYRKRYNHKQIFIIRNLPLIDEIKNKNYSNKFFELNLIQKKLTFCYHGLLSSDRDVINIAQFFKNNPNYGQVIFIGFGDLRDYIIKLSDNNKNIFFVEPMKFNELINFIKNVDITFSLFTSRSLNEVYALPNKMFESFCAKTPVIVNECGEASEIIKYYNVGWTIKNINYDLKNIINLLTKRELQEKSRNIEKMMKVLNWSKEEKELKKVYFFNENKYIKLELLIMVCVT